MRSSGQSVATEFDLPSESSLALCFVADAANGMPHLAEGMAQSFIAAAPAPPAATPAG